MPRFGLVTYVSPVDSFNRTLLRNCVMFTGTANMLPGYARETPVILTVPNWNVRKELVLQALISHRVCRELKLPVPDTHLVACKSTILPPKGDCLNGRDLGEYLEAIAAVDVHPHRTKQRIPVSELLWADQQLWRYLPSIAVHDELLGVPDRRDIALWIPGKQHFMLLSYESIFEGPSWTMQSLPERLRNQSGRNSIANLIVKSTYEILMRQMIKLAQDCSTNLVFDAENFGHELKLYSLFDSATIKTILDLLNSRLKTLETSLRRYIEKDQLFHDDVR